MALDVLIVDDSSVMRSVIKRTLRMSGLPLREILEAADGQAALEVLERQPVDLLLLDINMPGMRGDEVVARLRQRPEMGWLPIVIVSTESSETKIQELLSMGVEFVHKPFTPEQLLSTVLRSAGSARASAVSLEGPDF
jgi:two-component system, chemotaxis family, chemotaxis protein CheY